MWISHCIVPFFFFERLPFVHWFDLAPQKLTVFVQVCFGTLSSVHWSFHQRHTVLTTVASQLSPEIRESVSSNTVTLFQNGFGCFSFFFSPHRSLGIHVMILIHKQNPVESLLRMTLNVQIKLGRTDNIVYSKPWTGYIFSFT